MGCRRIFLCLCWLFRFPPEDPLEEMDDHDGEGRPNERSDQRDMGCWDLEVLIPGEGNKGDENPDPNEGDEEASKQATGGRLVGNSFNEYACDNRDGEDKQEIEQIIGNGVPGERDSDRKQIRESLSLANINAKGKKTRANIQIQRKKVRKEHRQPPLSPALVPADLHPRAGITPEAWNAHLDRRSIPGRKGFCKLSASQGFSVYFLQYAVDGSTLKMMGTLN
jgi:hypothetical protein